MQVNLTVFVVDDERVVRDSICALLRANGMTVEPYASAEEFLAAYQPTRRGCLVQDVRLQGMSGMELHRQLINMGSPLPVIIISGQADDEMIAQATEAGAVAVLCKPVPYQKLLNHIEEAFRIDAARHDSY